MNIDNLHQLIGRYEQNYSLINNSKNDEIFKWRAVRCFQDVWFDDRYESYPFAEKFRAATRECSVLVDNGQVSPSNGIVKMAEQEPEEVEHLFNEVLFADDNGDLELRQDHIEEFLEGIESVRQRCFPSFWKYSQDRHSAFTYLSLYAPEDNYIYKYSEAEEFAKCIEYGIDIGSGRDFKLPAYYGMCDLVVEALQDHQPLLQKYRELVSGADFYQDQSLHLLAFDIIYCARAYNLYSGMTFRTKSESVKAYKLEELRKKEAAEKQAQIDEISDQIHALELRVAELSSISLLNVQAQHKQYGTGIVVAQKTPTITVQFEGATKSFIINKKYPARPTFEDDADIVAAFTEYDDLSRRLVVLQKQLTAIRQIQI